MKRILQAITILALFSSVSAAALDSENSSQPQMSAEELRKITYVICKNKNVARTVRVNRVAAGACTTTYSKEGVESTVAESQWLQNCSKVLVNIRTNLEKADWKCKDISETRVSAFVE